MMNLSTNKLPKGLVTLEGIFNFDDQARSKGLNLAARKDDHIPMAIAEGKTLDLEKLSSKNEKEIFIPLCQEFNDIFSYTCWLLI